MTDKEKVLFIFHHYGIHEDVGGVSVDAEPECYDCETLEQALDAVLTRERFSFAQKIKDMAYEPIRGVSN